jgi:membrane protein involved in colicin uptake
LFQRAWEVSFRKELITKSFEATGIWPMDPEVILKRFTTPTHTDDEDSSDEAPNDWQHLERLIRAAVGDPSSDSSKKLSLKLHHLQVQNELVTGENEGLREALITKKKHKKHGKALDLQQRRETWGNGQFWSPCSLRESRHRNAVTQRLKDEVELQKAEDKKLKAAATLYNKKIAEEKRVAREEAKVVKDREKAEKAAAIAAKKAAQNTKKSQPTAQPGKRKASRTSSSKDKPQKRVRVAAARAASPEAAPAAPPKLNRRGRAINVPAKYR